MRDFANLQGDAWLARLTARAGLAMLFAASLAFLAPFGTYRLGALDRIGYWTLEMAAWLILSTAASWLVLHIPTMRTRGYALRLIVATLIACLPMIVVTGISNTMISGWHADPEEVFELFVSIMLIGGGFTWASDRLLAAPPAAPALAIADADHRGPAGTAASAHSASAPTAPSDTTLLDRLPAHMREDILCLQVEDHYVRVHASHGSIMVLMRFSDALRGVDHIPGSRVHRSWWVRTDAVTAFRRTGRTAQLSLSNGATVPVSQPYLAHAIASWGGVEVRAG